MMGEPDLAPLPEVLQSEIAANVYARHVEAASGPIWTTSCPTDELRRSPAWLDTVSKMRDAHRNQDLEGVLTYHGLLERLAKANDVAAAEMLARQQRMDEADEVLRQAQLFINDSGNHPSDDYYRRFMTLERKEMLRKLLVGIDADVQDLNRAGDLDAPDDNEMLRQLLAAIDADVQDLNRAGDLEAPDGAPVQNELDAYWNERLDPIEVLEPIDGEADAVSDSVRTSVTGAAGSVEDATPAVGRVLEGVETPPAGRTEGSDGTPALYRIDGQHLDQVDTAGKRRTRLHPTLGSYRHGDPVLARRIRPTLLPQPAAAGHGQQPQLAVALRKRYGVPAPRFRHRRNERAQKLLPKKQPACRLTLRSELRQVPGRDRGAAPGQRGR